MKSYEQMVADYRKRRKDTMTDTLAAGLACVDNLAAEAGLMENAGEMAGIAEGICNTAPFVVIAATEGAKVLTRRKPVKTGLKDGVFRMVKSGAAMGVGAAVAAATTAWAALPAAMGTRIWLDKYKSKMLTGMRVQSRTLRLKELGAHIHREPEEETLPVINREGAVSVE